MKQTEMFDEPQASAPAPREGKPKTTESALWGISIRGWIAIMIVGCVCVKEIADMTVSDQMMSLASMAVAFYLGQKTSETNRPKL